MKAFLFHSREIPCVIERQSRALHSLFLLVSCFVLYRPIAARQNVWVATWMASPEAADADPDDPLLQIDNQTVRERLRVSVGGAQIRLRLSNEFGATPLHVGSVTVAIPIDPSGVKAGSIHEVTFNGQKSVTIPAGAPVLSDPVTFPVVWGAEISASIYFPGKTATPTIHGLALKRAVISPPGDFTRADKIEGGAATESSILISGVLVPAQAGQHLVVAFGDSVTDGDKSTVDADRNWPSDLARRLAKTPGGARLALVNAGIAGNRLLADGPFASLGVSALARFDRDALTVPGVTHIVLLEGINDLGFPGAKLGTVLLADPANAPSVEDITGAYRQLIARAHTHGIKVIGVTLTPFEGASLPGYYTEAKEDARQAVNKWIRMSGAFDGIIDFDAVLRDPDHPSRTSARFASEDHLHPNDAGYQAMADTVDLRLFY